MCKHNFVLLGPQLLVRVVDIHDTDILNFYCVGLLFASFLHVNITGFETNAAMPWYFQECNLLLCSQLI